jgi:DNA-binding FadR family transcriptional regulator
VVITRPDLGAVVRAVSLQMRFDDIRPIQVTEARNAIEISCARLAAERITDEDADRIRDLLREEHHKVTQSSRAEPKSTLQYQDFHLLLADITGNPAMSMFVAMITRVLDEAVPQLLAAKHEALALHRSHVRIGTAIIAGDPDEAERAMTDHLDSVHRHIDAD